MILTVTLNAALDVTYQVGRLIPHTSHRVTGVHAQAGGKGINVGRVLASLGFKIAATGFVGGRTGAALRAELSQTEIVDELVEINSESRRTVTVVSTVDGDATVFNEPGGLATDKDWGRFLVRYRSLLGYAEAVVCSGSLPPGAPPDAYRLLVAIAHEHGVACIVDAEGDALTRSLLSEPDVVKPNKEELEAATGVSDPATAARLLRDLGSRSVIVSLGADGLLAVTPEGEWSARTHRPLSGNPTGAGDACVAALAAGVVARTPWPERLVEAAAISAAAVHAPFAGGFDLDTYAQMRTQIRLEALNPSHIG